MASREAPPTDETVLRCVKVSSALDRIRNLVQQSRPIRGHRLGGQPELRLMAVMGRRRPGDTRDFELAIRELLVRRGGGAAGPSAPACASPGSGTYDLSSHAPGAQQLSAPDSFVR